MAYLIFYLVMFGIMAAGIGWCWLVIRWPQRKPFDYQVALPPPTGQPVDYPPPAAVYGDLRANLMGTPAPVRPVPVPEKPKAQPKPEPKPEPKPGPTGGYRPRWDTRRQKTEEYDAYLWQKEFDR